MKTGWHFELAEQRMALKAFLEKLKFFLLSFWQPLYQHYIWVFVCLWRSGVPAKERDMGKEMHFRYFLMLASQFAGLVCCLPPLIFHQGTRNMPINQGLAIHSATIRFKGKLTGFSSTIQTEINNLHNFGGQQNFMESFIQCHTNVYQNLFSHPSLICPYCPYSKKIQANTWSNHRFTLKKW